MLGVGEPADAGGSDRRSRPRSVEAKPSTQCPPLVENRGEAIFTFTLGDATLRVSSDVSSPDAVVAARITIGGQMYSDSETASPDGQKIFVRERFGAAFFGVEHLVDLQIDNGIVTGSIDGQALVPEPLGSGIVELASGAPLPTWTGTPSANAQAQALYAAASPCLDPPPTCLTGKPGCVPPTLPPDAGASLSCNQYAGLAKFECHFTFISCLIQPPTCDPVSGQCFRNMPGNWEACVTKQLLCQSSCNGQVGNGCYPLTGGSTCCDNSTCETTPASSSSVCGAGSGSCCVPWNDTASQVCASDADCCPDGLGGSSRSCFADPRLKLSTCCGNGGACCFTDSDCCPGTGTVCQGIGANAQSAQTSVGQTPVTCLNTCCTPMGSACVAGQTSCCPVTVGTFQQFQVCDSRATGECAIPPQGLCASGDLCADGTSCTCNQAGIPGCFCCSPNQHSCKVDEDCCGSPAGQICDAGTGTCRVMPQGKCDPGLQNECADGLPCTGGICCTPNASSCLQDADCCVGETCNAGVCSVKVGGQCTASTETCADGVACTNGVCCSLLGYRCTRDADCCTDRTGQFCNGNHVCQANPGNLAIDSSSTQLFSRSVSQDPVALNAGDLLSAPSLPMNSETVEYIDGFSTPSSQTYILVMARDPSEQENTLEQIVESDGSAAVPTEDAFLAQTIAPKDPTPSWFPSDAVSLPDSYGLPFPDDPTYATTSWPLSFAGFTESPYIRIVDISPNSTTQFASYFGGVQGVYLQRLGVCAYDISTQSIIHQIASLAPGQIDDKIYQQAHQSGVNVTAVYTHVSLGSFVNATPEASGGFVMLTDVDTTAFSGGDNGEQNSINYTYYWGLQTGVPSGGIFSPFVKQLTGSCAGTCPNAWFDGYGDLTSMIRDGLEQNLPPTLVGTLQEQAMTMQAQPIPNPNPPSSCSCSGGPPHPSCCYVPCDTSGFTASQPSPSDPNDPSWYQTQLIPPAVVTELNFAVANGAQAYNPTIQGAQIDQLKKALTGTNTMGANYNNLRCNFCPTYETDSTPVPVVEIVVRAKRLNVFPDFLELVWFDGPDLQHVASDEYGNEAFALYIALLGAGLDPTTIECLSQAQQAATFGTSLGNGGAANFNVQPVSHRFAHDYGSQ